MKKLALLISSSLLLTACGGGGSGDGVSTTSSNGKTKITAESINNMSTGISNIDFDTALNVVIVFVATEAREFLPQRINWIKLQRVSMVREMLF